MTDNFQDNQTDKYFYEEYRSRYSVLLILSFLLPMIFMIYNYTKSPHIVLLITFILLLLIVLFISGFRYIIADNRLIFKTWFVYNGEVSIYSIEKIERTYLILSSNAGSLKRLGCKLKKGSRFPFLLISPKNEEKFLETIKQINPKIEIKVSNKKGFYRFWDWDI